jgi:site-specific recombinase XerD
MGKSKRHPGAIDRRGDTHRIRLCVGGERYSFTVLTSDRREAEKFARDKCRELEEGHRRRSLGLPDAIAFSELLALFERDTVPTLAKGTQDAYRDSLKPIRQYFLAQLGDPLVMDIGAKHIAGYLAWRRTHRLEAEREGKQPTPVERRTPLANRTLQKDRAVLHRIFALAVQLEYRDGNPVGRVEPPKADRRAPVILGADEYEKLLAACEGRPMLALYTLTLGEAGLRCESEALRLRWEDVDFAAGFLWIASGREGHRTKSGKGRWVPMTKRLRNATREHFARYRLALHDGDRTPWVFHHEITHRKCRAGQRIGSLRASFRSAANRAKVSADLHQHDLRHRRVTVWLAEGRDVVKVKEAMGHADLRTTMEYTHLAREHLSALVEMKDDTAKNQSSQ